VPNSRISGTVPPIPHMTSWTSQAEICPYISGRILFPPVLFTWLAELRGLDVRIMSPYSASCPYVSFQGTNYTDMPTT